MTASGRLSEPEYLQVCAACEALLQANTSVERTAIPWLHVIREHPVFLVNYADLVRSGAGPATTAKTWKRRSRESLGRVWQLAVSAAASGREWCGPQQFSEGADVLFVSHLLNVDQAGEERDFYFGGVPSDLRRSGVSSVVALINHTGRPASELITAWSAGGVPRVILERSLGLSDELELDRRMRGEARRLAGTAANSEGLHRRAAARAAEEARGMAARGTLRMHRQIRGLVTALRPKAIVVTFEGHAWERMAFAAAREVTPTIRCVGYQHAAIFKRQFAIRQQLAPDYTADCVLTAGPMGCSQLRATPALRDVEIAVVGSDRAPRPIRRDDRSPACLVVPEGLLGECNLLFDYSLGCAAAHRDMTFIWRLHPSVTFDALRAANPRFRELPANVIQSTRPLDEDLGVCQWALYRGTTTIVQAVAAGLQPIYLRCAGEMTIDPMHEAGDWRSIVETPADFARAVVPWSNEAQAAARSFALQFFVPFDAEVVARQVRGSH